MENVILVIHLVLALGLIGVVLLQRSEGGGLGMGGGGGGGVMSARGAATALGKVTWILAAGFICTSIALTVIAAQNAAGRSVVDAPITDSGATTPTTPDLGTDLLPPTGDLTPPAPTVPPATDPAAPAPAAPDAGTTPATEPAATAPVTPDPNAPVVPPAN